MKLYVVRHGQTNWNHEHKMQGREDISLNEFGIEQARTTKDKIKLLKIDICLSSPLKRAVETAKIITEGKCALEIDPRLSERDYGEFEGVKKEDFSYDKFWYYKNYEEYSKAENIRDFFTRIYEFLDEVKVKYKDKNVLIVTHGGVIKAIECYAHGMLDDKEIGIFLPDNATVLEYDLEA